MKINPEEIRQKFPLTWIELIKKQYSEGILLYLPTYKLKEAEMDLLYKIDNINNGHYHWFLEYFDKRLIIINAVLSFDNVKFKTVMLWKDWVKRYFTSYQSKKSYNTRLESITAGILLAFPICEKQLNEVKK